MHTIHRSLPLAVAALSLGAAVALGQGQEQILRGRQPIPVQEAPTGSALSRDQLPLDTRFVLHIDVRGLLGSVWWKVADESVGLMDDIIDDEGFKEFKSEFGFDPFKDLLAVTVVGHNHDGDDAVVILRTTDRVDKALAKARQMDRYSLVAHDGLELETWSERGDGAVHVLVLGGGDSDRRRIVVGQDPDQVAKVARTLLGEAPSLAGSMRPAIQATPLPGSYIYLEVGLPLGELLSGTPAAKIAAKARRFVLDVGERRDSVYLDATVETASEDDAHDVADVINGARSMLALSGVLEEIPVAFSELVDELRARVEGNSVRLSLSISMLDLREGLEEIQEMVR